jgi:HD-like signal output (HDOD) protein
VDLGKELEVNVDKAAVEAAATLHHASVGSTLVRTWSLPEGVATTILRHHDLAEGASPAVMTTQLADVLAHSTLAYGDAKAIDESPVRSHWTLGSLNLYPEDVDKLFALRERVVEIVASVA